MTDNLLNQIHHAEFSDLCARVPDYSVDMILCDLPYMITQNHWDTIIPFDVLWLQFERIVRPDGAVVLTANQPFTSALVMSNTTWFQYEWIWRKSRKTNFLNAKIMPMSGHETVLVFGADKPNYYPVMTPSNGHKSGAKHQRGSTSYGDFGIMEEIRTEYFPNTVLEIPHDPELSVTYKHRPNKVKGHPTQKPVALFEYLIKTYTQEGDLVFDPCVGSGTTAMACHRTGRNFICGDYHLPYVEMARKRLQDSDPFQPTQVDNNHTQLSLFESMKTDV